jgi:hypothetical protein
VARHRTGRADFPHPALRHERAQPAATLPSAKDGEKIEFRPIGRPVSMWPPSRRAVDRWHRPDAIPTNQRAGPITRAMIRLGIGKRPNLIALVVDGSLVEWLGRFFSGGVSWRS